MQLISCSGDLHRPKCEDSQVTCTQSWISHLIPVNLFPCAAFQTGVFAHSTTPTVFCCPVSACCWHHIHRQRRLWLQTPVKQSNTSRDQLITAERSQTLMPPVDAIKHACHQLYQLKRHVHFLLFVSHVWAGLKWTQKHQKLQVVLISSFGSAV